MKVSRTRGQGLIEYLILVCLIAVSAMWVVGTVGRNVQEHYADISRALGKGDGESVGRTEAEEESYRGRGMHDYMKSARSKGGTK